MLGRIEVFWRGWYSGEEGARENRGVLERRVLGRIEVFWRRAVFWRGGCSGE